MNTTAITLQSARELFFRELEPVWKSETDSLFFVWWNEKKGWTRSEIQLNIKNVLSESEWGEFKSAITRLKNQEPIQYILGSAPFAGCRILVNENVLIPRPETEELVYLLKEKLKAVTSPRILDLCTGSGCVAIGLKKLVLSANVDAVDISEEALKLAEHSARLNQLDITFRKEDVLNFQPENTGIYDLIVSNPPYITEMEKNRMSRNVLQFEPHLALFAASDDPMQFYKAIVNNYSGQLKEKGILAFEINENYSGEVIKVIMDSGFYEEIGCVNDLQEKPRMILSVKKCK